jgi:hypothetical protein
MKRLSVFILVFAVAFTVLFIGPSFLSKSPFGPYPLMQVADVFDIMTPLVGNLVAGPAPVQRGGAALRG